MSTTRRVSKMGSMTSSPTCISLLFCRLSVSKELRFSNIKPVNCRMLKGERNQIKLVNLVGPELTHFSADSRRWWCHRSLRTRPRQCRWCCWPWGPNDEGGAAFSGPQSGSCGCCCLPDAGTGGFLKWNEWINKKSHTKINEQWAQVLKST